MDHGLKARGKAIVLGVSNLCDFVPPAAFLFFCNLLALACSREVKENPEEVRGTNGERTDLSYNAIGALTGATVKTIVSGQPVAWRPRTSYW